MTYGPKLPSVPDIKRVLSAYGVTARRTQDREIRVNLLGFPEKTAYYTDDSLDALHTGIDMARRNSERAALVTLQSND